MTEHIADDELFLKGETVNPLSKRAQKETYRFLVVGIIREGMTS